MWHIQLFSISEIEKVKDLNLYKFNSGIFCISPEVVYYACAWWNKINKRIRECKRICTVSHCDTLDCLLYCLISDIKFCAILTAGYRIPFFFRTTWQQLGFIPRKSAKNVRNVSRLRNCKIQVTNLRYKVTRSVRYQNLHFIHQI